MRIFVIEWWNPQQGRYMQEYFTLFSNASKRFEQIQNDILDSQAEISTIHTED